MRYQKSRLSQALLLTAAVAVPQLAWAQIEEVIVTAQKRAESSQEVPISIQAFSGDSLTKIGVDDTDDLGFATPGLQMNQGGVANLPFIRGIGSQDATPAQDNSVSTYVDGVLQASVTGSALVFNNIERVEVLKGPQGTLFGRNTTGGVINIITKDPSQETALDVSLSYGDYETASFGGYGTTGITDNLTADIAVYLSDQGEGYSDNLTNGDDVNKREDDVNLRSKWKFTGEDSAATFIVGYSEFSDDMGYVRGAPEGSVDLAGNTMPGDEWDIRNDTAAYADFENAGVSLKFEKDFSFMDLVSITAWNRNELDSFTDNDFSALYFNNAEVDFYERTATQEFQFLSNDADSNLTWIGGLYFLDQHAWGRFTIIGPQLAAGGINTLQLNGTIDSTSIAGFGEIAWNFTDATRLTAGLRWTRDKREFEGDNIIMFGALANPNEGFFDDPNGTLVVLPHPKAEESWEEPTYRVVLDHHLNDEVMVYASYNRGFRSGNFITAVGFTGAPQEPFNPEFVDAYEIGMKSDLLDGAVRANASAYFYKVEDLQFQILQGLSTVTVNAAEAEIKGAELDLTWEPTGDLTFMFGASYIDGEYTNFPNAISNIPLPFPPGGNAAVPAVIDVKGNQVGGSPEWAVTGAVTYARQTDSGEYSLAARASYNDGFPWEPDGRLQQPNYTILNVSAGWRAPSDKWGVRLTGKNLLDEYYSVTTRSVNVHGDFQAPGAPRTYYVTVDYKFF
jgi:iron complex outermembrane recepter protein